MRLPIAAVLMMLALPAWADDDALHDARAQAAQLVTIAKLAPLLCPEVETDDSAIRDLEEHAQISEQEVMDRAKYGVQDELIARSFAKSVKDNALQSCADIADSLGANGAHLVKPKVRP